MGLGESKPAEPLPVKKEEQLETLHFTRQEIFPESTVVFQLDDGTIFYYYHAFDFASRSLPKRLYYKVNGQEVDVSLPDESKLMKDIKNCPEQSLHSVAAHGNALYLDIRDYRWGRSSRACFIDKVVITKAKGAVITHLRDRLEGEVVDGLLCERKQDTGPTVVYHLYDDPVKDAIPVDRSESELQGSMLKFIHRKRAVYFKQNFNLAMPSVKSCEHCIIIEGDLRCATANENSPFIYFAPEFSKNLKTLDTRNMKFLPDLKFEGTSHIFGFVKLSKGAITVRGADCLATAQLPIEYFDPTVPYDHLFKDFKSEFLDKFEPLGVLGEGGFGCVFEARNRVDQWKYAVKRIPLRGSEQAVDSALKEVRTLAALKHDGLVCYNSSWIEKPPARWQKTADAKLLKKLGYDKTMNYSDDCVFIYIQMELCTKSLHQWLYSTRNRDITQAKVWFKQLVSAVHYLHQMNKIHRDLKPLNVLFDANGRVKICDLGLIAERELRNGSEIDITRTIAGTLMYMAPEQRHGNYSSKVDVFSLGLILAELCVCMTIHQAYEAFMMYQNGRSTSILKHLPAVDSFVSWLTNVKPTNRPNCDQILNHQFLA